MERKTSSVSHGLTSHPSMYFLAAWSLCAFVIYLDFIPRITQYRGPAITLYIMIVLFNIAGSVFAWSIDYRQKLSSPKADNYWFLYRRNLTLIWSIGSVVEIIVSGGLPIWWIYTSSGKTYEDFGIPSIHGFMNAIYLFLTLTAFMIAWREKSPRYMIQFLFFFTWSVLVVSRALMTIVLLQSFTFFLIKSSARWQVKGAIFTVLSGAFIFIFGLLGDTRAEAFSILQSAELSDIDPRYSFLVWIYCYLTSPIANLALNMSVHSASLKFVPTTFLLPLLPSALQRWMGFETGFYSFSGYLAHDAFNVGTGFIQIYIDWGYFGVFLFDFILGFFGQIIWNNYRLTARAEMLSLFIPCVILTVFSNQFNQLPVLVLFALFGMLTRFSGKQNSRDLS